MGLVWQCAICAKWVQGFSVERTINGSEVAICMECELSNFKPQQCTDCGIYVVTSDNETGITEDQTGARFYYCGTCYGRLIDGIPSDNKVYVECCGYVLPSEIVVCVMCHKSAHGTTTATYAGMVSVCYEHIVAVRLIEEAISEGVQV